MYSSIFVVAIKQYANTVDVRNKTSRNSYGIITIVLLLLNIWAIATFHLHFHMHILLELLIMYNNYLFYESIPFFS